ncbi:MAG: zf-HC2 domain-containing protein [Betaproteobacteria bacterium]|nr:zf-HC2 domain-containing protein [Betaproteobacteria bacterium]
MRLLTCKETTRLVSQGLDRELAFGERVALRLHLAICVGCRRAGSQMRYLRGAVRKLATIDLKTGF